MSKTKQGSGSQKTQGQVDLLEKKKLEIDARSQLLITEFFEHLNEVHAGGQVDPRVVFEAWAIQKIAGLQVLLLEQAKGAA